GPQDRRRPRRHRLLADREMQESTDLAERVCLRRLLLEATDQDHVAQQPAREAGVEPEPRRRLLRHCLRHDLPPAHYSISTIFRGSPRPAGPPPRPVLRLPLPLPNLPPPPPP